MNFLADFLPVLLFFLTYFVGEAAPARAHDIAMALLGGVVRGGTIPVELASILLASAVAIVTVLVQISLRLLRRQRVSPVLWLSAAIFVVFGGATIYFHDDTFIKWKPTVLYWLFAAGLLVSEIGLGRNLIRHMMEPSGLRLPDGHWRRLNLAWVAFFVATGALNLYVAFNLSRSVWVSFKSFGLTLLTFVFVLLQGLVLSRYFQEEPAVVTEEKSLEKPQP